MVIVMKHSEMELLQTSEFLFKCLIIYIFEVYNELEKQ